MTKSPTRRRERCAAIASGLLLVLGAIGCSDAQTPSTTGQAPGELAGGIAAGPSVPSALERVDPQDPERPYFHDFGTLDFGEEVYWKATLRNTGSSPIRILGASPMCGCTRLNSFSIASADGEEIETAREFGRKPEIAVVPPGGTITASIDILSQHTKPNRSKLALVRLTTDSELTTYLTFELHFFPAQPFITSPPSFEMPRVPTSHGAGKKVKIMVVAPDAPGIVHRILEAPAGIEARLETTRFAGETIWYVHVEVAPLTPMGAIRGDILLAVSDSDGNGDAGRLEIPVEIRIGPDNFLDPGMVTFGAMAKGSEKTVSARLNGLVPGSKIGIKEARIEGQNSEFLSVQQTVIRPDEEGRSQTWQFDVTISKSHPLGYLGAELVLVLDEPFGGGVGVESNELRAAISGIIRE